METLFLCLANSKKYGERCIAGIELRLNDKQKMVAQKTEDNRFKWIRPVSDAAFGQVDRYLVNDITIGDILALDCIAPCPQAYQSENVLFEKFSIRKLRQAYKHQSRFDKLVIDADSLFGNTGATLSPQEIKFINHSLMFVKVQNAKPYVKKGNKNQLRLLFDYAGASYDLPITDIHFPFAYFANPSILADAEQVYLTISLGIMYKHRYYKLVAGILYF
ncbi:MAG: hypothetical protein JJT94_13930 [Bernardetiaceae bacterium]|nr:hypothetical protein [Bernardetiaceae bacterium]